MTELSRNERLAFAVKLRGLKRQIAEGVTDEYVRRHPDYLARYGERCRELCVEDTGHHLEFLAAAVEGGSASAFASYARWAARVLHARGVDPRTIVDSLELLSEALVPRLGEPERGHLAPYLAEGVAAAREAPQDEAGGPATVGLGLTRELFLQALLRGQRKPAWAIALEAVREGHPITDIYAEVLGESLREVGRLWESNRITVAAEHTATAIVQFVLAQLYPLLPTAESSRGKAIITGVEGELHQVGANMVADVLEAAGWNVRFLGTNVPHPGVLRAVEEHQADAVGISATTLLSLPKVRLLVADLRQTYAIRCPRIVVGGGAFRFSPALAEEVGADACGVDLRSAPALFTGPPPAGPS